MDKTRLDVFLVQQGYFKSREKAKQAILEERIKVNGTAVKQPKQLVCEADDIVVESLRETFVGRGAYKLKHALDCFGISLQGRIVLDIGASTGGFTQVSLQYGAAKVYALDVGSNQLDESLRADERVVVMENRNFRYAESAWFKQPADFVCCDVSFISLHHIIPALSVATHENSEFVFLVKPQFEAGPDYVNKHGVVSSKAVHRRILNDIWQLLRDHHIFVLHVCVSPITGKDGNIEYLMHAKKNVCAPVIDMQRVVDVK